MASPSKTKLHTQYKLENGDIVPGVTTILGLREKPALHGWIARITKEGQDWTKYRDEMAEIGSLAHKLILADLKGEKLNTSDYTPNQVNLAENCYLKYLEWAKGKTIEPIIIEESLVCPDYRFGGTPDFYGLVDGVATLVDYKTGGVYEEAYYQVSAYAHLIEHDGKWPPPSRLVILGIPKTETEKFVEQSHTTIQRGWDVFQRLAEIYWLERENKPLTR